MSVWKTHAHVMKTHCVITRRVHTDVSAWTAIAMQQTFLEKSVMTSMSAMKVHWFISSQLLYCSRQRTKKSFDKKLYSMNSGQLYTLYFTAESDNCDESTTMCRNLVPGFKCRCREGYQSIRVNGVRNATHCKGTSE